MAKDNLKMIKLATSGHPHGLKGEIELRLVNPNYDECILDEGMSVHVFPASEKSTLKKTGEVWKITKLRFGNKVLCVFEGIRDRTHLETFMPFEVQLPRDEFPETDEDEVYLVDLIDMDVVSPEGEKLGNLESFSDNGQQYLFDIRLNDGSVITVPYVDAFFPEIKTDEKKIVMVMPEYTE